MLRAINRRINYIVLQETLLITMIQHVEEIALGCVALCNIKYVLTQTKKY